MKKYETPEAQLIFIACNDVITTSIGEDGGDDDGEWTGYVFDRTKQVGEFN